MDKIHVILGTNLGEELLGTDGRDLILGKKGDDKIDGGAGNDLLFGGKGNDLLLGGAGDDFVFGDKGNDQLDGGAGNDKVLGGKGDDVANYTLAENVGAHDLYDGGKGFDTLQLTLTSAEQLQAQSEIDAFRAFLEDDGKVFHFESLGLTVRNFEALDIVTIGGGNTEPVANPDSASTDEDHEVSIDVLANDTDADVGAALKVIAATVPANSGSTTIVGDQIVFNPGGDFQYLAAGESARVTIDYTISDEHDATASSFVDVLVTGVNDAPVAADDSITASAVDGRIRVAVLGVENSSTHVQAAGQLDFTIFQADPVNYTPNADWGSILGGYEVVVLGDRGVVGQSDYLAETNTGLFTWLGGFVAGGGGVVTTGNFAYALKNMPASIQGAADAITPITPAGYGYAQGTYAINVAPMDEDGSLIAGGVMSYTVPGGPHELAAGFDGTQLATFGSGTAIAYDEVGPGRTVYLGALFTAGPGFPFFPEQTREGDVDHIFEQAVAWAAGARGGAAPAVTVTIDVLGNDTDVDTSDVLAIYRDTFPTTSANGAALSFDTLGNIVYTPTAAGLQDLVGGQPLHDTFDYTVMDSHGGFDTASVNLTVDHLI